MAVKVMDCDLLVIGAGGIGSICAGKAHFLKETASAQGVSIRSGKAGGVILRHHQGSPVLEPTEAPRRPLTQGKRMPNNRATISFKKMVTFKSQCLQTTGRSRLFLKGGVSEKYWPTPKVV